jgi:hypothetical protein
VKINVYLVAREQGVKKHLMIIDFQGNKDVAWRRRAVPVKRPSGWFHNRRHLFELFEMNPD